MFPSPPTASIWILVTHCDTWQWLPPLLMALNQAFLKPSASGIALPLSKTCPLAFPSSVRSFPSVLLSTLKNQEFISEEFKAPHILKRREDQ